MFTCTCSFTNGIPIGCKEHCYKGYHCIKCEQDLLFDIYDTTIEICVLPRLVVFASLTESLKDSDHEFSAKEVVSRFWFKVVADTISNCSEMHLIHVLLYVLE